MNSFFLRLISHAGFGAMRRLFVWGFASICSLLFVGGLFLLFVRISHNEVAAQERVDTKRLGEAVQRQIRSLLEEKDSRTPAQQKLDSQLLYASRIRRGQDPAPGVSQLQVKVEADAEANTVVDITAIIGGTLLEDIEAAGADVISVYAQYNSLRARVPIGRLEEIAALPQVRFIQPKQEPYSMRQAARQPEKGNPDGKELPPGFMGRANRIRGFLTETLNRWLWKTDNTVAPQMTGIALGGSKISEGDVTHRAAAARTTFGANGAGVRIGVIADGVVSLAGSQAAGDLPANVIVLPGLTGSGDEGTAMLEIINDLAPGARLYFATANGGVTAFAQAIRDLRAAGCDIILDDAGYINETPFQDGQAPNIVSTTNGGVVWQAVNDVVAAGVLYFSAAGNKGNKNDNTSGTWQGDFADGGALALVPGGTVHDFGGGLQYDVATGAGDLADLFWADPLGGSNNDYDLFVLNSAGTAIVASSTNVQNGTQDPFEAVGSTAANNRLVILKKTGAASRFLYLENLRGRLTVNTEGNMRGHACAQGAFSVAATPAANAFGALPNPSGPFPNPFTAANTIELFSSDGPRRIFFNANGTAITPGNFSATGGSLRQKPDITAADGVTVTGAGGFSTRFYGTSAAAPHAAAIGALLKSSKPSLTSAQVRAALTATALDIETAGIDRDAGAGIVMAFEAMQSIGATAAANLQTGTIAAIEAGGNGNTFIEPGESATLNVQLLNTGPVAADGVSAVLTTTTPGVVISTGSSAYANLAATTGAAINATAFAFNLTAAAACPLRIDFVLTVTFTGTGSPKVLPFSVQAGLPPLTITSTLDATAPNSSTGFTATTGLQNMRLTRDGQSSLCGNPKACPGTFGTGTRRYDAYSFLNCSTTPSCVTVTLGTACTTTATSLFAAAYLGNFDPNNICTDYLADLGVSPGTLPVNFSFTVPAGATFTVVVHEVNTDAGANCAYTLNLDGLCCQSSGVCPTVSQIAPATSFAGNNIMVAGANLGGVTGVKFAGGAAASFNVVNNATLNVLVPNGAASGPLTISRPGCPDLQTPAFTVASNVVSNNEIAVDDGTMETISNVTSSGMSYFVNRLTPTAYPVTVTKLAIFFPSNVAAPPSGTAFDLLVGTNPGGTATIDGTKFTATPATTQPGGAFAIYNVPPATITAGDFVVGFRIPYVSGVFPAAADISSASKGRSYISSTGSAFTLVNGNFGFRAATLQGCQNVTGISPAIGLAGASVMLAGTNLNGVSAVKFFNNATAQFSVVNAAQINTTVPNAAITGPITLSKSSCPDMTAPVFAIGAAVTCPTVTGISPANGLVGAPVTINGSGFTGASSVKFANNVLAQFTVISDTQITTTVPTGAVTGAITISKPNCTDTQTASFTVTVACPTVSGISPTSGLVGSTVAITGTNLTGVTAVKFANNVSAQFTVVSATGVTATVPNGAVTGPITISKTGCPDVQSASFTVTQPCPTITIGPASLPAGTLNAGYNQSLTASGGAAAYNFTVSAGALPNGLSLSSIGVISGTPTQLGSFNLTVKATDANGCIGIQPYTLAINCPSIGLSPATLPGGNVGAAYNQTITASPAGSYTFALTAGALAAGLSLNATTGAITGVPTNAGTANFTITATGAGPCTGSQSYSIIVQPACPAITGISPASGAAGATVTITGMNFTGVTGVKFAGNATAAFTINSDTQMTAVVPASAVTGPIAISKTGCADATTASFTVITCPTITGINPASGVIGSTVTINGSGFAGVNAVKFGNNASAAFNVTGDTQITTTVPNGAGSGPITISKPGCSDAQTASFTVIVCPVVTGVSPVMVAAGAPLVITGSGFTGVTTVRFAGNSSATFAINSEAQITATVPATALSGPVTLVKPGCQNAQTPAITIDTPRLLRAGNGSGAPGSQVIVPIELVSQGDENAIGCSLTFDPAILSNPQLILGSDATSGQINVNTLQVAQGRVGLALSLASGQRFNAGVRQVAVATFTVAANAAAGATPIGFGDQPIAREITNDVANILPANYSGGSVTIAPGYEADVAPRPNGSNNGAVTVSDWVLIGRFAAGLDTPAVGSEFQRADCAPRDTLGDGRISLSDYVQAGRYAAGLDPVVSAGGPTAPAQLQIAADAECGLRNAASCSASAISKATTPQSTIRNLQSSRVRLIQDALSVDGSLLIELDATGAENAMAFSLRFDPMAWRFISALAVTDAAGGALNAQLQINANQDGRIGIVLALPSGRTFAAGRHRAVRINFAPFLDASAAAGLFSFADWPVQRAVVGVKADAMAAEYFVVEGDSIVRAATVTAYDNPNRDDAIGGAFVTAYGNDLAVKTALADQSALPGELAGTIVKVRDSAGNEHSAKLRIVSPSRVGFQLPVNCAPGLAMVTITNAEGGISVGTLWIDLAMELPTEVSPPIVEGPKPNPAKNIIR